MIKINLATRKQSASVSSEKKSASVGGGLSALLAKFKPSGGGSSAGSGSSSGKEALAALPLRRLVLALALCAGGYFYLEDLKEEELKGWDDKVKVVSSENEKLKKELQKTKEYASIKKSIDADELLLKNKIGVIQTLLKGRQAPHEILLTLATSIPKEVWLKGVKIDNADVSLKGFAIGFNQVSGFMKSLNESAYFSDVRLQNSQQEKDDGKEIAAFELAAKRRGGELK